jgi:hypothetical protein
MTLSSPCPVTWWQLKPNQVPIFCKPEDMEVLIIEDHCEVYEQSVTQNVIPNLISLVLTTGIGIKLYRRMKLMHDRQPSWVMHGVIGNTYSSLNTRGQTTSYIKAGLLLAPTTLVAEFHNPTESTILSTEECLNLNLPVWPTPSEPEPEIHRSTRFEREDVI